MLATETMNPVIIIGAGLAGYTVAREFRKLDKLTPLVIVTKDSGGFYSKPMLSNAFAQRKTPQQLVTQTAEQMSGQIAGAVLSGTTVLRIDPENRRVHTDKGVLAYRDLIIAAGAEPVRLPIPGNAAAAVLSVNHVDDYAIFHARVGLPEHAPATRVAILGAGLIGCEFADDISSAGHAVTLIDPNSMPLASIAPPVLSRGLQQALIDKGVAMRLGTTAASIDHGNNATHITLSDGSVVEADLVLSAVGLRPNCTLASTAGLTIDRGIVVNALGLSSDAHIYALGDCAQYTVGEAGATHTMPYIAPLMSAARAIARTLAGTPTPVDLKPTPVLVKTPSFPIALVPPPPDALAGGAWVDAVVDQRMISRFYDAIGVMVGFGVAPQDAAIRNTLMTSLGSTLVPC
jgi:rubredoxin---NAD+ reductase